VHPRAPDPVLLDREDRKPEGVAIGHRHDVDAAGGEDLELPPRTRVDLDELELLIELVVRELCVEQAPVQARRALRVVTSRAGRPLSQ